MARARVRFNAQKAAENLFRKFEKIKETKSLQAEIGQKTVEAVKAKAKIGKPLNNTKTYPKLKRMTIIRREYLERFNQLDPSYKLRKPMTFTGQLMKAIRFSVEAGKVFIFVADTDRRPYKTGPGSKEKNPPDNKTLYGFLREKGFFLFTAKGINGDAALMKRINAVVKRHLRRSLRRKA